MGRHTRTQRMIAEARDYLEKSREDNVRAGYPPSAHSISFLYTQLSSQRVRKLNGKEAVVDESRSGWRAFKKAMNDACEEGIIPKDWIGPETQRSPRESGTSQYRAINMLRDYRPDLLDRWQEGKISLHAAMLIAGFRAPTITVNCDSPSTAAGSLLRNLDPDFIKELIEELSAQNCV